MKKRFLIIALPVFIAMSSCSFSRVKNVQNDFDYFKEDTVTHEECFGDLDNELKPMRLGDPGDTPEAGSGFTTVPKIGVQYSGSYEVDVKDEKGDPTGEKVNCFAVRFVAAIEGLEDGAVTAEWTRGVSDTSSNPVKPVSGGHYSSVEYTTLNDGNVAKEATSEGGKYAKYIVYTMYDIPESHADSFIVAYLTLTKGAEKVRSKAVAARIAGDHAFSFEANKSAGYFLAGTIKGNPNSILDLGAGSGSNKAEIMNKELYKNDLFGYYLINNANDGYLSSFQYYGWETFKDQQYYLERDSGSELFKVRVRGTYDIYVNEHFKMWMECDSTSMRLYFKPDSTWLGGNSKSAVWYGGEFHGLTLVDPSAAEKIYYLDGYDFVNYPSINFTKHDPSKEGYSWYDNGGNCWDQTVDVTYGGLPNDLYTITGGDYKARSGSWSTYNG